MKAELFRLINELYKKYLGNKEFKYIREIENICNENGLMFCEDIDRFYVEDDYFMY